MKETMYKAIQELAKVTVRQVREEAAEQQGVARSSERRRKKGKRRVEATETSSIAHAAKGAVKKGKEATPHELRCLRAVLAGHLPESNEREGSRKEETKRRTVTRRAIRAIHTVQETAAQMQEAWYKEAKGEIAQRNAEEGMRRWMGPAVGAWIRAGQTWQLNAAGRRVGKRDEPEEAENVEGEEQGTQGPTGTATPKKGEQVGAGLRYESRNKRRGSKKHAQEGPQGWSIARALAEHKRWEWRGKGYSDKNEERWRQIARERWEKEEGQREEDIDNADEVPEGVSTGEKEEEHMQGDTEAVEAQNQRKRTREEHHEDENSDGHGMRQRRGNGQSEQDETRSEQNSEHGAAAREERQHTEEERDGEHAREEQRGTEPMQEASGGTHRATQRKSEEETSHSNKRKRGKQKMNPQQQRLWDAQQREPNAPNSSDDEDGVVQQHREQQREHDGDDKQTQQSREKQTREDASPTAQSIEVDIAHELRENSGGVAVNVSVFVRRNPTRGARPKEKEKTTKTNKPARKQPTKGPIFKGTYMMKMGAKGGGLKYMIRLGERTIEIMENTYEATRPPKRGHER
jgi:hypothetical protein